MRSTVSTVSVLNYRVIAQGRRREARAAGWMVYSKRDMQARKRVENGERETTAREGVTGRSTCVWLSIFLAHATAPIEHHGTLCCCCRRPKISEKNNSKIGHREWQLTCLNWASSGDSSMWAFELDIPSSRSRAEAISKSGSQCQLPRVLRLQQRRTKEASPARKAV